MEKVAAGVTIGGDDQASRGTSARQDSHVKPQKLSTHVYCTFHLF